MKNVSFVVTVYNKAEHLPGVVKAILAQKDLDECEYIFVDDGSTDSSVHILEDLLRGQDNVNIICQENTGPAIATNVGVEAATKPYIKLVDGDDLLHPRATSMLIDAVEKYGAGLAYFVMEPLPSNVNSLDLPDAPLSGKRPTLIKEPVNSFPKSSFPNLTGVLASTSILQEAGGCDPRVLLQDYSVFLAMGPKTNFVFVPEILGWYPPIEENPDNRASEMGGGAQVLHDLNLALAYFVADHPDLESKIKARILQHAAGRAWKWARRREGCSLISKYFFRYICARLSPLSGNTAERVMATCEPFRLRNNVRMPG